MDPLLPFDQAASLLPFGLRQFAFAVPQPERIVAEEIRLRVGRPISITLQNIEKDLPGCPKITPSDLRTVIEIATQASAHTALDRIRQGFVTVRGGHRLGICGTAAVKDGAVHNIRFISSINIRIARQIPGIANDLLRQIRKENTLPSILVIAPPGGGKTTLLRDLIRGISDGAYGQPLRVGVADERGELAATWEGVVQLDLGSHTDVIDGCSKADGLIILLRGMNPQVLAMDEITAACDLEALQTAAGCGVTLLATAHGCSLDDMKRRPLYSDLLRRKIFQKILLIEINSGVRQYRLEEG